MVTPYMYSALSYHGMAVGTSLSSSGNKFCVWNFHTVLITLKFTPDCHSQQLIPPCYKVLKWIPISPSFSVLITMPPPPSLFLFSRNNCLSSLPLWGRLFVCVLFGGRYFDYCCCLYCFEKGLIHSIAQAVLDFPEQPTLASVACTPSSASQVLRQPRHEHHQVFLTEFYFQVTTQELEQGQLSFLHCNLIMHAT